MKKIKKWEPDDFELEMTTHWSFPKRGIGQPTMLSGVATGHLIYQEISFSDIRRKAI